MSRTLIDALSAGLLAGGLFAVVHTLGHQPAPAAAPAPATRAASSVVIPAGQHNLDVRFEVADGKPVSMRFVLSQLTPTSFRLEQAVSRDDGKTWAPNWTAVFQRGDKKA